MSNADDKLPELSSLFGNLHRKLEVPLRVDLCHVRLRVAEHLLHRTGHSLSPGPSVHGLGANLDDMESRDTRTIMPGTGFTVEPGLYVGDFGVRLEVDVYVDAVSGPRVTTPVQDEIVLLM